ncbi:sensor histidine kinase [Streptomyces sp. NPDC048297]|uniref:sensor histidine kinase n=1 Tax=Streptomyces sp. NPDC048297 TaxID=3365531 RepID=UPI00371C7E58
MSSLATVAITVGGPLLLAVGAGAGYLAARRGHSGPPGLGTPVERATFHTLHTASLAAPPLRAGLTADTARKAARRLRPLLGDASMILTDEEGVLAWEGPGAHHGDEVRRLIPEVVTKRQPRTVKVSCDQPDCPVRWGVVTPLVVDGRGAGALAAFGPQESAVLSRAVDEVARWVGVQLELVDLERARSGVIEAEIRALRAQISPHFIYNSLASIASFVRTDPDRARELLLEFADFTRYSFRKHGDFTTLADELRSIEQYLELARARFGDRLEVNLRIAPEVLSVTLPFLCLQPLVENALKHGLEESMERSTITIVAQDDGPDALVSIEDNGVGMEPERLREILKGAGGLATGIGLSNVNVRLRQVYGDAYGLVIETAVGAGMKVTVRIPKFRAGVQSAPPSR